MRLARGRVIDLLNRPAWHRTLPNWVQKGRSLASEPNSFHYLSPFHRLGRGEGSCTRPYSPADCLLNRIDAGASSRSQNVFWPRLSSIIYWPSRRHFSKDESFPLVDLPKEHPLHNTSSAASPCSFYPSEANGLYLCYGYWFLRQTSFPFFYCVWCLGSKCIPWYNS